jgi:hypothetical protein
VCAYNGTASTSTLVARSNTTFASYSTSLPATTVSPSSGPSGAATNILVSVPTTSTIFTGAPDTLLARNSCPGVRPATAALGATTGFEPFAATTTTKINASKLAVVLPAGVIAGAADVTTPWNVCVYASTSTGAALLAAPGTYSAAQVLDLSTAAYAVGSGASGASASGPVQGGSTITISGLLGIPTDPTALLTASLGGSPIDITTVNDATSFTGTTTKHAPGAVALSITTAAGTQTTSTTPYTYNYGIAVTPNTAVAGSTPVLDITGAGFTAIPTATWGTAYAASGATGNGIGAGAGKARVLLTDNAWNNQSAFGSTGVTATNGVAPLAQCTGVLVISDNELICTMDLAHKLVVTNTGADVNAPSGNVPVGVYNVTLINSDAAAALTTAANNYSVVSSTSAFTVAPF